MPPKLKGVTIRECSQHVRITRTQEAGLEDVLKLGRPEIRPNEMLVGICSKTTHLIVPVLSEEPTQES